MMDFLLDTHIVLWWLNGDESLSDKHNALISNHENICYISAATIWEISIKSKIGKLEIDDNYIKELKDEGFLELPVTWAHTNRVKDLPLIHKDPFDRLLIAQAQLEQITIITVDDFIPKYDLKTI